MLFIQTKSKKNHLNPNQCVEPRRHAPGLSSFISHQVVQNLCHLAPGDGAVGLEAAVGVAADDALGRHGLDIEGGVGGDLPGVREGQFHRGIALLLGAADHGGRLGAGQTTVGIEIQLSVLAVGAVDDALGIQGLDGRHRVVGDLVVVGKGQDHVGVLALIQTQVAVEHHRELGPGDVLAGAEGAVGVARGNAGGVQELHVVGTPVALGIGEGEFIILRHRHVIGGPTNVAGGILRRNGDAVGSSVGDQRGGQGTGGGVVGEVLLLAVPGDGDGGPGQDAVHQVGNAGSQGGLAHRQGHLGRLIVHGAAEGSHHLIQIKGAAVGRVRILLDQVP